MRRFSAHYMLAANGFLLKNGILITQDNGEVIETKDTGGSLPELDRLEFHNGVLIPGISSETIVPEKYNNLIGNDLFGKPNELSTVEWFQCFLNVQKRFPQQTIRELFSNFLLPEFSGFRPGINTGVYLISGADLAGLKLTENSRLKKLV